MRPFDTRLKPDPDATNYLRDTDPGDQSDLRTPSEWLKDPHYDGITIRDADGWRDGTWDREIGQKEFEERLWKCTLKIDREVRTEVLA